MLVVLLYVQKYMGVTRSSKRPKAKTHTYTSLVLPNMLHIRLRKAALDEGRKMQDLVEDAVRRYLDQRGKSDTA